MHNCLYCSTSFREEYLWQHLESSCPAATRCPLCKSAVLKEELASEAHYRDKCLALEIKCQYCTHNVLGRQTFDQYISGQAVDVSCLSCKGTVSVYKPFSARPFLQAGRPESNRRRF
jgi:hypothetical protein